MTERMTDSPEETYHHPGLWGWTLLIAISSLPENSPRHAYAIVSRTKEILTDPSEVSSEYTLPGMATFYKALSHLAKAGYLIEVPLDPTINQRRIEYHITEEGKNEVHNLARIVKAAGPKIQNQRLKSTF